MKKRGNSLQGLPWTVALYNYEITQPATAPMLLRNLDDLPDRLRPCALTIGNFDGVHVGHARIIERLCQRARRFDGSAVVFTFDPHPAQVLRPEKAPRPLCWAERKAELLEQLGVDFVVVYPTTAALLTLDATTFFDQIVVGRLGARDVVEGPNFFFGHRRKGDIRLLEDLCRGAGIDLETVEPVQVGGRIVSSSRIRRLLEEGSVEQARRLLVQPHRIRGPVVHGAGRGAGMGFPTANVEPGGVLVPAEGIYAARAVAEGTTWPAAVSVGPNPTFDDGRMKVEAFLIGFEGDLYGRTIEVDFLARLRNIVRFDGVAALVAQMSLDVAATQRIAATMDREGVRS